MANGIRRPKQSHRGLYPQDEKEAGVLPFPKRAAKPPMARTPPTPAMKATGKPAVRAKPAMRGMDPAGRRMPDEDRYPRSTAAYGMAHGGTVVDGYEYEGEGIVAKSNTPSKKHIKRNPVFQKKVAKKGSSTPSSKSRKINPIFKTKKAARGGKIK